MPLAHALAGQTDSCRRADRLARGGNPVRNGSARAAGAGARIRTESASQERPLAWTRQERSRVGRRLPDLPTSGARADRRRFERRRVWPTRDRLDLAVPALRAPRPSLSPSNPPGTARARLALPDLIPHGRSDDRRQSASTARSRSASRAPRVRAEGRLLRRRAVLVRGLFHYSYHDSSK